MQTGRAWHRKTILAVYAARLDMGADLVARRLFDKLSLGSILDAGQAPLRHGQPLSERFFLCSRIG